MLRQFTGRVFSAAKAAASAKVQAGAPSTSARCTLLQALGFASDASTSDDSKKRVVGISISCTYALRAETCHVNTMAHGGVWPARIHTHI